MTDSTECNLTCKCTREFYGNIEALVKHSIFEHGSGGPK